MTALEIREIVGRGHREDIAMNDIERIGADRETGGVRERTRQGLAKGALVALSDIFGDRSGKARPVHSRTEKRRHSFELKWREVGAHAPPGRTKN